MFNNRLLKFFILFSLVVYSSAFYAQNVKQTKYQLARQYLSAGDYDKAEEIYKELIKIDPESWLYISGLNSLYFQKGEFDKSIDLLTKRIKDKPLDVTAIGELGNTYYKLRQLDKAFEIWDQAFDAAGNNQTMISVAANFPIRNRCYDKAIEILTKGKSRIPNPIPFLHQIGNIYIAISDVVNATKNYCELVHIDEKQLAVSKNAIRRMFLRNEPSWEVETILNHSYQNTQKNVFLELLKEYYLTTRNFISAKEIVYKLFASNKNIVDVFNLANILLQEKTYNDAKELYQFVINNSSYDKIYVVSRLRLLEIEQKTFLPKDGTTEKDFLIRLKKQYEDLLSSTNFKDIEPEVSYKTAEIESLLYGSTDKFKSLSDRYSNNPFGVLANNKLAQYYLKAEMLDTASVYLSKIVNSKIASPDQKNEAEFGITKILFWQNKFSVTNKNLSFNAYNFKNLKSNEAIELLLLLTISKQDSVNLSKYSRADFLRNIDKNELAEEILFELYKNENLLALNFYAAIELAKMKMEANKYYESLEILENLIKKEKISPFYDKALYLQGKIFHSGLDDYDKAVEIFSQIIQKFPDSIYLNECRNSIMQINNKVSEKYE